MSRASAQQKLFDSALQLPEGLVYRPEFISPEEEWRLLAYCDTLPFKTSRLNGYEAKRRYLHFGWEYDWRRDTFVPGDPLPRFVQPLVRKIGKWLDIPRSRIVEALLLEYPPGAQIGWHVDRERFEHIIGISFGSWATMRFRPHFKKNREDLFKIDLEPRSVYSMQNEIRWRWQHSVARTRATRYSLTFRTLPQYVHKRRVPSLT